MKSHEAVLFLFPADSDFDWRIISEWSEAHARLLENSRVARVNIRPSSPAYLSGIVSQLMEQWQEHLPPCSDVEAMRYLEAYVTKDNSPSLISIIRTDEHFSESLQELISLLMRRSTSSQTSARVCLLISPGAEGPKEVDGGSVLSSMEHRCHATRLNSIYTSDEATVRKKARRSTTPCSC